MTAASDYLEGKLRDLVVRGIAYTPPTLYLALFTTATTDAGGGTEVTGGSYARQATGAFNVSGQNPSAVTFVNMPAVTVSHAALYDASTAGNSLIHGPLTSSVTTLAGESLVFNAGSITVVFL